MLSILPIYLPRIQTHTRFRRQGHVGYALGVNLIGTMVGGWLEYLSMVFGLRFIWLLVLAVYVTAWCVVELNNRQSARSFSPA